MLAEALFVTHNAGNLVVIFEQGALLKFMLTFYVSAVCGLSILLM